MRFALLAISLALVALTSQAYAGGKRASTRVSDVLGEIDKDINRLTLVIERHKALRGAQLTPLTPAERCAVPNGGAQFAKKKLFYLDSMDHLEDNGFDSSHKYVGPKQGNAVPNTSKIYSRIVSAFNNSPHFLQLALCKLTYVFIDAKTRGGYDWGFWEAPDQRNNGKVGKYVTLMADDWDTNDVKFLDIYESNLLHQTLGLDVQFTAVPNNQDLTAISRLAHEVAHVVWFTERVDSWDCDDDGGDFFSISWESVTRWMGKGFHKAKDNNNGVSGVPTPGSVYKPINNADDVVKNYNTKHWASMFAQIAPDEDFAESYRMLALAMSTPALTSLTVKDKNSYNVANLTQDINAFLGQKGACILRNVQN